MIDRDATEDVLLAYCHNGSVANCFMLSVFETLQYDLKVGYGSPPRRRLSDFHHAQGPYIHGGRSMIAKKFLEEPELAHLQWLWFCDNDMDFAPETLYAMLRVAEEQEKKFVAAAYWNQYPGTNTYLSWLVFTAKHGLHPVESLKGIPEEVMSPGGLLQVNAVGMGCTLIHRDVLQDVADMHANDPWDTFGADVLLLFEDGGFLIGRSAEDFNESMEGPNKDRPVANIQRMGEDVTFSIRAARCGYPPHGITWLSVDHFKTHRMLPGDLLSEATVSLSP